LVNLTFKVLKIMIKWIFPQPGDSFLGWIGRSFLIFMGFIGFAFFLTMIWRMITKTYMRNIEIST